MIELTGWGRYPRLRTELVAASTPASVRSFLAEGSGIVARGNGRAYGDAAIGERITLSVRGLDRMRAFDPTTGRLTLEAGVLLADVLASFVPRGFFPPVVPGTKLVTIGGMIAADVHGKNHHRDGGFGDHVEELKLVVPGGEVITCSRYRNVKIFAATIGGMGLTGTIVEATFRLKPVETGWMRQHTIVAADLASAMAALQDRGGSTYSVAWIDCLARGTSLGRSLIYVAEHATRAELEALRPESELFPPPRNQRLSVPVNLPSWALNRLSVATFNELYYRRGAAKVDAPQLVHWDPYFFPLDCVGDWNRIYGRDGFVQHQFVIPTAAAHRTLAEILDRISRRGTASFLAVLKQLGGSRGVMSFPIEGYTLALDLPATKDVFRLLDEVDQVVMGADGRVYLAKDARQSRETFEAGYPRLAEFGELRRSIGAHEWIISHLSKRLGI